MTEIGVLRSARQQQIVIRIVTGISDYFTGSKIDAFSTRLQNARIGAGQQAADGCRDFRRTQGGHRYLVQQRLEQMMVLAIDDGDVDVAQFAQLPGRVQPGKPCTHDHDAFQAG